MNFEHCPFCKQPTNVGSHWDCVFSMMAEWVKHEERLEMEADPGRIPGEGEKPNG